METKNEFIERFKLKTKRMAVDIARLMEEIKSTKSSDIIVRQIIRSATSTGANYRAACKARSGNEFFAKMSIVVEESDETLYWMEIIEDLNLIQNKTELERLQSECSEITKLQPLPEIKNTNNTMLK